MDKSLTVKITKEEINKLPLISFDGEIIEVDNQKSCLKACEYLKTFSIIGFDTETRPAFKKGEKYDVSLLQLSTKEKCFLFRLKKIPLLDCIKDILSDESIVKAGVAISDDIKGLKKLSSFKDEGFIELATLAKEKGMKQFGLRSMAAVLFGKRLSKKNKLTNWENTNLTDAQKLYAATDAWIGLLLFEKLS